MPSSTETEADTQEELRLSAGLQEEVLFKLISKEVTGEVSYSWQKDTFPSYHFSDDVLRKSVRTDRKNCLSV